jgi:hypothetical protein
MTVSMEAANLLNSVAKIDGHATWEGVMEFSSAKMNSPKWLDMYAGLTAMGAAVAGVDPQEIESSLNPVLTNFINLMEDPTP